MTAKAQMNRDMQLMEKQLQRTIAERNAYAAAGNILATRINTQARQIVRLQGRLARRRHSWHNRTWLRVRKIFRSGKQAPGIAGG